ncbi:MAG: hypothetical protein WD739_07415 [Actinomycetota bacterium]
MAATVLIRHAHGAGPTYTDVSAGNTRHVTDDTHVASGSTNPIPVPAAGSNYGYWVPYRLDATATPVGTISNLRAHTDGASGLPAGVTVVGETATTYVQPTGTPGTTGLELDTPDYATLAGSPVDVFGWTAGAPISIAGSLTNPATGPFGDFLVTQMQVASTVAAGGPVSAETLTILWDET